MSTTNSNAQPSIYIIKKQVNITIAVLTVFARIFAIASLVLCAYWGSKNETSFLGIPSWYNALFQWHPILMVCGFFLSLVFAITRFLIHFSN